MVKFFGGSFVDGVKNQARLLSGCLFVAGSSSLLLYLVFASKDVLSNELVYVIMVASLWSLNGVGQSLAWPSLAQIFLNWFPNPTERGSWYSMLSTNQNVGSTLSPRVYPFLITLLGWPVALYAPSILTLVYATLMLVSLSTWPENSSPTQNSSTEKKHLSEPPGFVKSVTYLFRQPYFLALCAGYAPISVIRISLATWTPVVFESYGMTLDSAAQCIVALEIGAFMGSLCAGFVSDTVFRGKRGPVMVLFSALCTPVGIMIGYLLENPLIRSSFTLFTSSQILFILFLAIGFFSFPPHMLTGLVARELSPANMRSTAGCVVRRRHKNETISLHTLVSYAITMYTQAKGAAQIGAVFAGWPLQRLSSEYGWKSMSYSISLCGILAMLGYLPLVWVTSERTKKKQKDL